MQTLSTQPSAPSLHSWQIDPTAIRLCRRLNGQLWKLGEGGFGKVSVYDLPLPLNGLVVLIPGRERHSQACTLWGD